MRYSPRPNSGHRGQIRLPGVPRLIPELLPRGMNLALLPGEITGVVNTNKVEPGVRDMISGRPCTSFYNTGNPVGFSLSDYGPGQQSRASGDPQLSIAKVPTNVFSMEVAWISDTASPTGTLIHFDSTFPASSTYDRAIYITAGVPKFYIYTGVGRVATSSISTVRGQFVHIIGISDGTNIFIYVNGKLAGTQTGGTAYVGNTQFIVGDGNNPDNAIRDAGTILLANYATVAWTDHEVMQRWANPYSFYEWSKDRRKSFIVGATSSVSLIRQSAVSM